jgi:hypothetical protein
MDQDETRVGTCFVRPMKPAQANVIDARPHCHFESSSLRGKRWVEPVELSA